MNRQFTIGLSGKLEPWTPASDILRGHRRLTFFFFFICSSANNCQPRQNPSELPPAWQAPRGAIATNATARGRRWSVSVGIFGGLHFPRFVGAQRPVGSTAQCSPRRPPSLSPKEGGEGALIIGRVSCRSPLAWNTYLLLLPHLYDARILTDMLRFLRFHHVWPNVRTKTTIISNIHTPNNSSIPLHRCMGVISLILLQARRIRTPTSQAAH